MRQFLMTDPGGNCIRVGRPTSEDQRHRPAPEETFARALHHASLLADSKEDPAAAAKVVDRVLALTDERPTGVQLLQTPHAARGHGGPPGDGATMRAMLDRALTVDLTATERAEARDVLRRLVDLQDETAER